MYDLLKRVDVLEKSLKGKGQKDNFHCVVWNRKNETKQQALNRYQTESGYIVQRGDRCFFMPPIPKKYLERK